MRNAGTHHRIPRSEMEPLRITAWLQTPVVTSDTFLPFDGALYYTAMRERYGAQLFTEPGQDHSIRVPAVSLPLMRHHEEGPMWFYAASFARWPAEVADGGSHWNKRFSTARSHLVDFGNRRGTVNTGSAQFKAYHMPVFYRHALSVSWYVVGHRDSIERLLPFLTHLGKKCSQGWGAVLRWEVEPWPEDWSIRDSDGRLMRAVPSETGILTGFRPSYWLPKNQALCELPPAE